MSLRLVAVAPKILGGPRMSLGDRIRDWLDPGAPPRRRLRSQAQPFSSVGYEQRPLQRAQWVGLGLAAAAAIALTAGLVFVVLTLTRPGEGRGSATPTVSGLGSATPLPISAIFATSTPTSATSPTPLARPERVQAHPSRDPRRRRPGRPPTRHRWAIPTARGPTFARNPGRRARSSRRFRRARRWKRSALSERPTVGSGDRFVTRLA